MTTENKKSTNFNLHIGGDGVKSDVNVPSGTTNFLLAVVTCGLAAYLIKGHLPKFNK